MFDLPKSILGEVSAFTITSPDLNASLAFYQKLGFRELYRADWPFPWIQITDGVVLIMLRQDNNPYIAMTYYSKEIDTVVAKLKAEGINFSFIPKDTDMVKRYVFQSPDNLNISIVAIQEGFAQPAGPGMLNMPQQDYFNPEKYINKTCGMFGEFAHPVKELGESISFWQKIGFSVLSKFSSPYPWAIVSDGLHVAGLHETNNFAYSALTFFAADMQNKIDLLKGKGLDNFTEQGSSNVVLLTPEKQHINLFKLGM